MIIKTLLKSNILPTWIFYGINSFSIGFFLGNFIISQLWRDLINIFGTCLDHEKYILLLKTYPYIYVFSIFFGIMTLTLTLCLKLIYHQISKCKVDVNSN